MERPEKPNRPLQKEIYERKEIDWVEYLNLEKLRIHPMFANALAFCKSQVLYSPLKKNTEDLLDKSLKVDLEVFFRDLKGSKTFQEKNDSFSVIKDCPDWHLRPREVAAIQTGEHCANSQLHFVYRLKSTGQLLEFEELGFYEPWEIEIFFLAEVYLDRIAPYIKKCEIFERDREKNPSGLLQGLEDYTQARPGVTDHLYPGYYWFRYFNHHKPEACDRYLVYKDIDTGEIRHRFLWSKNSRGDLYLKLPYAPLLLDDLHNPLEISKIWEGSVPEIEYTKITK